MLNMAEDLSLFVYNYSFFLDKASQPGGIMLYIACFFTQFLYYPWLGALIITILLQSIQWLTHKSFDFNKKYLIFSYIPSFLLLIIATNVGRSFYLMNYVEYIFTSILGMLFILLSYYFFRKIENPSKRFITLCWLFPLLFYGISGSIAIYFFVLILISSTCSIHYRKRTFTYLLCLVLYSLFFFVSVHFIYPHSSYEQVLFGIHPVIPFWQSWMNLLPHLFLLFFFLFFVIKQRLFPFENRIKSYTKWTYTNLIGLLLLCMITASLSNSSIDFRYEMIIDRSIQEGNFDRALRVGKRAPYPTREMTVLRNFALVLSGKSGEQMFEYAQNFGTDGLFLDYIEGKPAHPEGAIIYFYLGAKHLAVNWADNEYFQNRSSFRIQRNFVLMAITNGHWDVAKKISSDLKNTWFHHDFAEKLYKLSLDTTLLSNDTLLANIKKRLSNNYYPMPSKGKYTEFLNHFYHDNLSNKVAYDYYMMATLLNKNPSRFVVGAKRYSTFYKGPLPKHYAEAMVLYNSLYKETLLSVSPDIKKKFNQFLKLKAEQNNSASAKNIMRRSYGNTYWWYYMYK